MTQALEKTAAQTSFQVFQVRPQLLAKGKQGTKLANTDILTVNVQVIADGGETNLHTHRGNDACWLVMQGRARFYTTDDAVVAELGKNEGLVIPRGAPYWFESASEENLVILRVGAIVQGEESKRVDLSERAFALKEDVAGPDVPPAGDSRQLRAAVKLDTFFGD